MRVAIILIALAGTPLAQAVQVFACEPEWGALVEEIAAERANIYVATTAAQDPHFIQARPSLIAEIRKTELLVCSGADLEVGWLPLLLRRSGNPAIQPGQPGHFLAADHVRRLEVPTTLDRGQGDIHPQGNPHVHLDPHNIRRIAAALAERLGQLDPAGASHYRARLDRFTSRWGEAIDRWEVAAAGVSGMPVIAHHRSYSYLAHWLDLAVVAHIEPKPGIPPSGAHLAALLQQFETDRPAAIIRTPYTDAKPSQWLSERLGVPALELPYTVDGDEIGDLFALFDQAIARLQAARE